MRNKILSIGLVVVAVVIIGLIVKPQSQPEPATRTLSAIKVGALLPLTGDAAVYGEPIKEVMQLAVDKINGTGGVNGQRLDFRIEDSKCDGKAAASAMTKLATIDMVRVGIGGICSSESLAAIPIAETHHIGLISPTATSPDLTGKSNLFVRIMASDTTQGEKLAELVLQKGWRSVAVLQEQTDYPAGVYKNFEQNLKGRGVQLTKEEFPTGESDFRSRLSKLHSTEPDALFLATQAGPSTERIVKTLRERNWKPPILLIETSLADDKLISPNLDILDGAFAAQITGGANVISDELALLYLQKYNKPLPFPVYSQLAYDAILLLKDALTAVGNDGDKVATWLHNSVHNWQGASGTVTIDPRGDRVGGRTLQIIKNGRPENYQ